MKIGVLALQGAFAEHQQMLHRLSVETMQIRNLDDWKQAMGQDQQTEQTADEPIAGLIIPGGESTAMMRIMKDEGLWQPLQKAIAGGLPVFGTCAGLIMLDHVHLNTMNIEARRNAYGRQLGSFRVEHEVKGIGQVPMTFIRAPYIEQVGEQVEVLAEVDGRIVAARQGNQLVTAFHPELDQDTRIHAYFLSHLCV